MLHHNFRPAIPIRRPTTRGRYAARPVDAVTMRLDSCTADIYCHIGQSVIRRNADLVKGRREDAPREPATT